MRAEKVPGEDDVSGKQVKLDEDAFMQNPEICNDEVAGWKAKNLLDIPAMSEDHWKLVHYLRNYWETYGVCPPIKMVTKQSGMTLEHIYELFADGPAHGACKVAGAPKPPGCV